MGPANTKTLRRLSFSKATLVELDFRIAEFHGATKGAMGLPRISASLQISSKAGCKPTADWFDQRLISYTVLVASVHCELINTASFAPILAGLFPLNSRQ
jgi:hypothetical protein